MQGKQLRALIGGCVALLLTASAWAITSIPNGWYLEANGGSSRMSNKSYLGSANSSGIAGNVNVGYKFMPYFAAEVGYSRYANTTIRSVAGTSAATDMHYSYDLAGKGILPVGTTGLEGFAKLGVERENSHVSLNDSTAANSIGMTSSSQNSASGLYIGVGAQYYFMPEFAVVVQWARAHGSHSTGTEDIGTVGVSFIFD